MIYHYKAVISCNGKLLSSKPEWTVIRDGPDHAEGLRGIARQLDGEAKDIDYRRAKGAKKVRLDTKL